MGGTQQGEEKMISPCISICRWDPVTNNCYGCGRTVVEKMLWKDQDTTDEWKENNLKECMGRLSGWQLESFKESYEYKVKYGISLFKKAMKEKK
tara:strand:+ start:350 stop:631 length:282 start_codon:yes stop_codon:yes gene_type:complete